MMLDAVLASGNPGKFKEMQELFRKQFRLISMSEFNLDPAEETGTTFEENALIKARAAAAQCGLPALSDDSGLEVDALNGAPGVFSARYAGRNADSSANIRKLLAELGSVAPPHRSARFRCVLALVTPGGERAPLIAHGVWEGSIAQRPQGSGGFGYDPVFLDRDSGKCAALMSRGEKGCISHRGAAARKLRTLVEIGRNAAG